MPPTSPASPPSESPTAATPRRRRWSYWVGGGLLLLGLLVTVALQLLDPWLRRTLERQVTERSQGRYRLRIGELHTSLGSRSLLLRQVQLQPAARWPAAARQPRVLAELTQITVSGVGLGALLRGAVVPLDSVVAAGGRVRILQLPSAKSRTQPWHEQLPSWLHGLRVGRVGVRGLQLAYGPARLPQASVRQATLLAHDVLLTPAGAADTTRLRYAAALTGQLTGAIGEVAEHRVKVGRARFSTQGQQLLVDSLRLWSVRGVAQRGPTLRVQVLLPRARATGIRSAELRTGRLRLDSVVVERPWVAAALPTVPPPPLHEVVGSIWPYLAVEHLRLTRGTLLLTGIPAQAKLQDLTLGAENVLLTAAGNQAPARIWYARAWTLRTGRIYSRVSAPLYWLGIRGAELDTRRGIVAARDLTLRPTLTPTALARYKGHQTPHLTVRVPSLRIAGFDFAAFSHHHALLAQRVELPRLRVLIAGDGRFPLNPKPSMVRQESLAKLPVRLNVRRITLGNGYVSTSYVGPKTGKTGFVTFNRLHVTLRNVTNDPALMTAATPLRAEASGWLQNTWYAQAQFQIPLLDPHGAHRGSGRFGPGSIPLLNSVTEPSRMVRFASGDVRQATIQFEANRAGIRGTMRAEYSNLRLTLLSQQGGANQKTVLTRLGTGLLNGLVVRDDNPRGGLAAGKFKVGSMESRRDPRVSVFSLWRQGLVSGLLHSIGVPQKKAQRISEAP